MYIATGLDLKDLKYGVVQPTLEALGWGGSRAVNLVTGTALAESHLRNLRQVNGPALSLWQVEPATFTDWVVNWLRPRAPLEAKVAAFAIGGSITFAQITGNLYLGALACRGKYLQVAAPIPQNDAAAMAAYHKKYYNTYLGKADATVNTPLFAEAIAA